MADESTLQQIFHENTQVSTLPQMEVRTLLVTIQNPACKKVLSVPLYQVPLSAMCLETLIAVGICNLQTPSATNAHHVNQTVKYDL